MNKSLRSLCYVSAGLVLVSVLLISLFLAIVIVPGYKSAAIQAWRKACHQNIRGVSTSIELAMIDGVPFAAMTTAEGDIDFSALSWPGRPPECPCQGSLRIGHIASMPYAYCTFHGDPDEHTPGMIDPGYSFLRWLTIWWRGIN